MKRFLLVHLPLLVLVTAAWFPSSIVVDDAFITFRYAENIAAGEGFRYNPTESILDARPLFTAMLALITRVGDTTAIEAAVLIRFLSAIAFAVACVMIFWRRTFGAIAVLVPWVVLADALTRVTTGMESVCFLAIAAWAIAASERRWWVAAGLIAASSALVRPDGVFLCGVLTVNAWVVLRRVPYRFIIASAGFGVAWGAYATYAFGSPLPPTIAAKAAQAKSGIWQELYASTMVSDWVPNGPVWLFGLAGIGALFAVARRDRLGLVLLAWFAVHQGAYAAVNVPAYPWYYVPLLGQAALLAAYGVTAMAERIPFGARRRKNAIGVVAATATAAVWLGVSAGELKGATERLRSAALAPSHVYTAMGTWLKANAEPTDTLGAFEVGIIGYYSGLPMADFFGLVTPDIAPLVPHQQHVDYVMKTYRPQFLLGWNPPTGHDSNMPQYLVRGYDAALAEGNRVLYRRRPIDEEALAKRVAALSKRRSGRALFGDFPKMLDFERFRRAFAPLRPDVEIVQRGTGREGAAIQLKPDGEPVVVAMQPSMFVDGAAIATWPRSGDVRLHPAAAGPGSGSGSDAAARFRTESQYAFVEAPVSPGPGPFRRVRIRLSVDAGGGRRGAGGRVWWRVGGSEAPLRWVAYAIPRVGEPQDIIIHLPDEGVATDETLEWFRIDLLDQPGTVTIEGVWLDRV